MEIELTTLGVVAVLVVVAVARFAPRFGIAAPIGLVLVGAGLSMLPGAPELPLRPDLVLMVVLPPILYSAAVHVNVTDFRRDLGTITALSVGLVIVSAVLVGLLVHALVPGLGLAASIALGAVVSPPDAVAATSVGKKLGLPPRLVTVLEGEGLVNDATALVLLRTAIAATAGAVSLGDVAWDFAFAVVVGAAVGIVVGLVSVQVRMRLDDPVLTTAVSFTVPFVAFIPAEELHASGVLAVVAAGLVTGHQGLSRFSAQDRLSESLNWRTAQLLLENGVFLAMGYQLTSLVEDVEVARESVGHAVLVALAVTGVLIATRVLFVAPLVAYLRGRERRARERAPDLAYALDRVADLRRSDERAARAARLDRLERMLRRRHADERFHSREGFGARGGAVIAWAGMRGVVTLAAAQSLPADLPYRAELVLVAFTVALVTLVGQGGTLPLLIRTLGISGPGPEVQRREMARLVRAITEPGLAALEGQGPRRPDGSHFDPVVLEEARQSGAGLVAVLSDDALAHEEDDEEALQARLDLLRQRRELKRHLVLSAQAALVDARASGTFSTQALARAQAALDAEVLREGSRLGE